MRTKVRVTYTDNLFNKYVKGDVGMIDGYLMGTNNYSFAVVIIRKESIANLVLIPINYLEVILPIDN